jgi:hypothetical protein
MSDLVSARVSAAWRFSTSTSGASSVTVSEVLLVGPEDEGPCDCVRAERGAGRSDLDAAGSADT